MKELHGTLSPQGTLRGQFSTPQKVTINGTEDYNELENKPSINGVELQGDKSFEDLGELTLTNSELKDLIDSQFELIFGGSH